MQRLRIVARSQVRSFTHSPRLHNTLKGSDSDAPAGIQESTADQVPTSLKTTGGDEQSIACHAHDVSDTKSDLTEANTGASWKQWQASSLYQEGETLTLTSFARKDSKPYLIGPLQQGQTTKLRGRTLKHDDLIGKLPRHTVEPPMLDAAYRTERTSLVNHVRLTPRIAAPIYSHDASAIVDLFDIHLDRPVEADTISRPSFQMLEAGTGHGSLTLHLSRALHAANPARKPGQDIDEWKKSRHAVLHTIDANREHSKRGQRTVSSFRRGMYAGNVDFHVGDVSAWVEAELQKHDGPLLSHALLDLPSPEVHVEAVDRAMLPDAKLVVFVPSITQVLEVLGLIKSKDVQLYLEKVVELGNNGTTGGRVWDVRPVRLKAGRAAIVDSRPPPEDSAEGEDSPSDASREFEREQELPAAEAERKYIARPLVGDRITGGGFVAVFEKAVRRRDTRPARSEAGSEVECP